MDIHNVIFYTDVFLIHELAARFETDKKLEYYFAEHPVFRAPDAYKEDNLDIVLKLLTSQKENKQYLADLINTERFYKVNTKCNKEDLLHYLDGLYKDCLEQPICGEYLQTTEIGNAMRLLVKDKNFEKGYFFCPFFTEFIRANVISSFVGVDTSKISIVTGSKDLIFQEYHIDACILEDVRDLKHLLTTERSYEVEVVIPYYGFNAAKTRTTEGENLLEEIIGPQLDYSWVSTKFKDKDLEECKLKVSSIQVPL